MLGTDLTDLAAGLATALGCSVVLDPRDLVLPGVLVTPGPIDFDRLGGTDVSGEIELWLVAGDTNPTTALDELTAMLLLLRGTDYPPTRAEPITITLRSQSPDPLPALRCLIPISYEF